MIGRIVAAGGWLPGHIGDDSGRFAAHARHLARGQSEGKNVPPWTYRIFEPDQKTGKVCVRLLVSSLPSQGSATESIEALVEVPWNDGNEQAIRHAALTRLSELLGAEKERAG